MFKNVCLCVETVQNKSFKQCQHDNYVAEALYVMQLVFPFLWFNRLASIYNDALSPLGTVKPDRNLACFSKRFGTGMAQNFPKFEVCSGIQYYQEHNRNYFARQ